METGHDVLDVRVLSRADEWWGALRRFLQQRAAAAGVHLRAGDALDLRDQAQARHRAYGQTREVKLPPVQAVERATREGVMVVVPALAERQQSDQPLVAALIRRAE